MKGLWHLALAALLLLAALPVLSQPVHADVTPAPPSPQVFVYRDSAIKLNAPASVVVQFDKTQLVNVTSVGRLESARTIIIKDNVIIWNTTLPDVWNIEVEINYAAAHNQTIYVSYWSNNELVSSPALSVTQKKMIIQLQLTTVPPLKVPTSEEIANQVVGQVRDSLNAYTGALTTSISVLDQNNRLMWQIVVTNVVVSFLSLIMTVVALITRRK